uniref:Putative protease n=2 Tax=viral metagenome TaxID=1070528 RepID=A0A6M3L2I4_9ZZZZ
MMLLLAIIVSLFLSFPAFADEDKEKDKNFCPKTLISGMDQCLKCHISPSFKLRESLPDDFRVYPNDKVKIIEDIGKEKGYFLLEEIKSDLIKSYLDYLTKVKVDHAIIEIHSPGGSLFDAWRIVGLMQVWEGAKQGRTIETRCYGIAASAGFLVLVSGTKGHRFVVETAELMWHELISFSMFKLETPSDSEEGARVLRHLQDTGNQWVASRGNLTKEELDSKIRKKEFWMRGSEALEFGFVDLILSGKK